VIKNRDASEQRTLSDKCGTYLIWSMQLFRSPIVKTPTKLKWYILLRNKQCSSICNFPHLPNHTFP